MCNGVRTISPGAVSRRVCTMGAEKASTPDTDFSQGMICRSGAQIRARTSPDAAATRPCGTHPGAPRACQ